MMIENYKNNISLVFYKDNHTLKELLAITIRKSYQDHKDFYFPIDITLDPENKKIISGNHDLDSIVEKFSKANSFYTLDNKIIVLSGIYSSIKNIENALSDVYSKDLVKIKNILKSKNISVIIAINCKKHKILMDHYLNKINFIENLSDAQKEQNINILIQESQNSFKTIK